MFNKVELVKGVTRTDEEGLRSVVNFFNPNEPQGHYK